MVSALTVHARRFLRCRGESIVALVLFAATGCLPPDGAVTPPPGIEPEAWRCKEDPVLCVLISRTDWFPEPVTSCEIASPFGEMKPRTMGEAAARLAERLAQAGYSDLVYVPIPDGFIAVTNLEVMRENGDSLRKDRWVSRDTCRPATGGGWPWWRIGFKSPIDHLRMFGFVVTAHTVVPKGSGDSMDMNCGVLAAFAQKGSTSLQESLRAMPYTDPHHIAALVYLLDYHRGSQRTVRGKSPLPCSGHVKAAGLVNG